VTPFLLLWLPAWVGLITEFRASRHVTAVSEYLHAGLCLQVKITLRPTLTQSVRLISFCLTVTVLYTWSALSDERTSLSFVRVIVSSSKSIVHVNILSRVKSDSRQGFGLEIGFIDHLQAVTINNHNTIANVHTLQITTAHTKTFQSAVFTSRCPVTDSNSWDSSNAPTKSSLHRFPYNWLNSKRVSFVTFRHGSRRKHRSSSYPNSFRGNVPVCEAVTQQRLRKFAY
jgi:hypothetical protein